MSIVLEDTQYKAQYNDENHSNSTTWEKGALIL